MEECQICVIELNQQTSKYILLPCEHVLCSDCAVRLSGEKCPFCRGEVLNWPNRAIVDSIVVTIHDTNPLIRYAAHHSLGDKISGIFVVCSSVMILIAFIVITAIYSRST